LLYVTSPLVYIDCCGENKIKTGQKDALLKEPVTHSFKKHVDIKIVKTLIWKIESVLDVYGKKSVKRIFHFPCLFLCSKSKCCRLHSYTVFSLLKLLFQVTCFMLMVCVCLCITNYCVCYIAFLYLLHILTRGDDIPIHSMINYHM